MKKELLTKKDSHNIGFHFGVYIDWVFEDLKKYFPDWRIYKLNQYTGSKKSKDVLFVVPNNFKKHSTDKLISTTAHSYPPDYIEEAINAFKKQYKQRYEFFNEQLFTFIEVQFMYVPKGSIILQRGKSKK